jgi:hypothetical protein
MLFQSRRFIEYFPAFVLIFAAFAWGPLLAELRDDRKSIAWTFVKPLRRKLYPHVALWVMVLILLPMGWKTVRDSQDSLRGSKPNQLYQGASAWLVDHTPAGERVFQTDWDDFPRLFFYNTHNTYLVGLDPTYMQFYNPYLYDQWVDITRGRVENPSQTIAENFGATYILSDLTKDGFLNQAERDPRLQEVYRDDEAVIFQVVEE